MIMSATYTIRHAYAGAAAYDAVAACTRELTRAATTTALLVAAPLIGFAFVIALPLAGLAAIAWMLVKAVARKRAAVVAVAKRTALFFAAPFVGLAYLMAFPFVAIGMLGYYAIRKAPG
jgi:hypothetical protein